MPKLLYDTIGLPSYEAVNIGLPELSVSSSYGGFVSDFYGDLIAYGYDQGYKDALYARSNGYRTTRVAGPYDPYVYVEDDVVFEDIGYDPYSCFGERRRYLNEGYELGYRDAVYGSDPVDLDVENTNIDLVSILVGAVFS